MHISTASLVQLAAAVLASTAAALAVPSTHAVHERRHLPHPRINKRLAPDVVLPMRVGLAQDAAALQSAEAWLMAVADPASPAYGQHWTSDEVVEAFRPAPDAVDAVAAWLVAGGIARERITHSDNKAWLAFDATVEEAEGLLHTEYYHDDGVGRDRGAMVACNQYHLPKHIQEHVDYVTPGLKGTVMDLRSVGTTGSAGRKRGLNNNNNSNKRLGSKIRPKEPKPIKSTASLNSSSLANCDEVITPACLRALYQFEAPSPNATVSSNNTLGIFEEGDFYAQEDFNSFFTKYTPYIPNGTSPTLDSIDGGQAPVDTADAGGESNLDFLLAYPM